MAKKYDITAAGHICLDIIPDMPDTGIDEIGRLFKPGKLIQVNAAKITTGGPVSNTGLAVAKLGLNVAFVARIGDDRFGGLLKQMIGNSGHAEGISVSKSDRTSYTIVIAPPGIDRIYLHDPGANDHFTAADLNPDVIKQSTFFHFGYPPIMEKCCLDNGAELRRIFQIARNSGAITSLDMALPDPDSHSGKASWKKILANVLPFVDIFLPSIEEVFFMIDPEKYFISKELAGTQDMVDFIEPADYFRLAEECLNLGAKIVALKTAHRGYYILTADLLNETDFNQKIPVSLESWSNRELWCPAFKVDKIASATGSGDSSIAGFLAACSRGLDIETALKIACCLGYQNLHELDALSGIRCWRETIKMVESKSMPLIDIELDPSRWNWEPKYDIWIGAGDQHF